jgi:outer membrane protein assembly factor BamB
MRHSIRPVPSAIANALTALCFAVVVLASATAARADGLAAAVWPMLGSGPSHSSASSFLGPATSALAWRFSNDGGIDGGVAIDVDGSVFFGTRSGRLFALDPTGVERWSVAHLTPVIGVPALAQGGKLYVGTFTGRLYAFDAARGGLLWSFDTHARITTSPAVGADGNVYVGTRRGLVAVTPAGTLAWNTPLRRIKGSSPAIGPDGTIYVATSGGSVAALSREGAIVWVRDLGGRSCSIVGSIAIRGDRLYVGAADGNLRALDRASGNVVWAYQAGAAIDSGVSLGPDGSVHFGTASGRVVSLRDGGAAPTLRWVAVLGGGKILSTPAVDRAGNVYVGGNDRKVHALAASNGALLWTYLTRGLVRSAIAIGVGGQVFAGSTDRTVYAIGARRFGADCWSDAFIDVTGLPRDEIVRRFQILLAACGGPGIDACEARVQGAINADRFLAAQRIAAEQLSPAQYLAVLRDRTHKLELLRADGGAHLCDVLGSDADGDHVADADDACPGTPLLTPTHDDGCTDPSLPDAPSAALVKQGLAAMNLLLDESCGTTPPKGPGIDLTAIHFPGVDFDNPSEKEFWFSIAHTQPPGCGEFYEMEVLYRAADGTLETWYLVFPSVRGTSQGPETLSFSTFRTDPGTYGAFTRSKAFVDINNAGAVTHYRLRTTTYAGLRSEWGPLRCWSCQSGDEPNG